MKYVFYEQSGMGDTTNCFRAKCPNCGHVFFNYDGVKITGDTPPYCPDRGERQDYSIVDLMRALRYSVSNDCTNHSIPPTERAVDNEIKRLLSESGIVSEDVGWHKKVLTMY